MQEQSKQMEGSDDEDGSVLTISPENVCFVIIKAREFDAKDEVTEPEIRDRTLRTTKTSQFLKSTQTILWCRRSPR